MTKILFVCHGNICRSVSAQYILQDMVDKEGIEEQFFIDSAATSTEEIGNPIYPPMREALERKNIPIGDHRARQLKRSDYEKYDLIIGMDEENMFYMKRMLGHQEKIHYLMEYTDRPNEIIDDPWYTRQFDFCAGQIAEGCRGLLRNFETLAEGKTSEA
jgi:protein-tyrosine phosphatase